ncbi:hypothetical protein PQX77_010579 [Marasmius sp. AFHP31]|nr:hypothetical protein PQX77_010579 [Marasmius sp. AFHP31]
MLPHSQFQNVLNTNHSATSLEIGQIRELLIQPTQELKRLNSEIQHLKSTLSYLFSQRDRLQSFVNSHSALISPVRRLPPEVLSEIFVHCLQDKDRNPTRSLTEAPLLLTFVCRRWREIALSTTRLWRGIHIYFPSVTKRHEQRFKEIAERRSEGVKTWLSRSGSLPLSISLVVGLNRDRIALEEVVKPLLDVFFSFSHKWGDLVLRVPSGLLKVIEQTAKPEELKQLRTLSVDYDMATRQLLVLGPVANNDAANQAVPLAGLICNAPALRQLTVHEPIQNVYKLDVDWSKLTHFRAETGMSGAQKPEDILRVLSRGAPSLQSVILAAGFRPPYTSSLPPEGGGDIKITLPSLHTLSLMLQFEIPLIHLHGLNPVPHALPDNQAVGSQVQALFDTICTPNLKHLTVRFGNIIDPFEGPVPPRVPFLQCLLRSGCRLESLDIGFVMTQSALIECLTNVPTVKSLTIDECLWTVLRDRQRMAFLNHQNPMVGAITPESIAENAILTDEFLGYLMPSSTSMLCPELESLTLQRCESVTEAALVRLVHSRMGGRPQRLVSDGDGSANTNANTNTEAIVEPTSSPPAAKPFRHFYVSYHREKGVMTDEDLHAREDMKVLKMDRIASVAISYPKSTVPTDLPQSGQQSPGGPFRSPSWRSLLWEH